MGLGIKKFFKKAFKTLKKAASKVLPVAITAVATYFGGPIGGAAAAGAVSLASGESVGEAMLDATTGYFGGMIGKEGAGLMENIGFNAGKLLTDRGVAKYSGTSSTSEISKQIYDLTKFTKADGTYDYEASNAASAKILGLTEGLPQAPEIKYTEEGLKELRNSARNEQEASWSVMAPIRAYESKLARQNSKLQEYQLASLNLAVQADQASIDEAESFTSDEEIEKNYGDLIGKFFSGDNGEKGDAGYDFGALIGNTIGTILGSGVGDGDGNMKYELPDGTIVDNKVDITKNVLQMFPPPPTASPEVRALHEVAEESFMWQNELARTPVAKAVVDSPQTKDALTQLF
jgi:hypothetical protein